MNIKFKSIGSDPEFFVYDPKGKPYPATLFAKGSKEVPSPIGSGFFEQRDNLSFEGNIPPAYNKLEFISSMRYLREYFEKKVAKFGYSLSPNGVEYFEHRYLQTAEGMEFGCSKVVSAWDSTYSYIQERPTPVLTKAKYRVAGFHIHIGYNKSLGDYDLTIARLFDLFVTMPSHIIKPEPERLVSYGKFGMIRRKEYGVECRTLSTYFTQIQHLEWVWDQVMKIEEFINSCNSQDIRRIVSNNHYIGDNRRLRVVFFDIFNSFEDKSVLTKFKETNEIYTDETFKARRTVKTRLTAKQYYYTGTSTATTATETW